MSGKEKFIVYNCKNIIKLILRNLRCRERGRKEKKRECGGGGGVDKRGDGQAQRHRQIQMKTLPCKQGDINITENGRRCHTRATDKERER